jgi:hypothetical protein
MSATWLRKTVDVFVSVCVNQMKIVVGSRGTMTWGRAWRWTSAAGEGIVLRNNSMTITPVSGGILPMSHKNATAVAKFFALLSAYLVNKKTDPITGNSPRIWVSSQKLMLPLLKHTKPVMKAATLQDNLYCNYTTN